MLNEEGRTIERHQGAKTREEVEQERRSEQQIIEEARSELDEDTRIALWRRCHQIIWEDQPYTFLIRRASLNFYDGRIRNVQRTRAGMNRPGLWSLPGEWYVPAAEQRYDG